MKNVMPMQPYLVLDTDDYEVKKEMKSGISHFYEFSKKKNSKVEMKAVPDGSVDLLFGIGEQDVKTYIGGTVLAAKGWEFEDGRSYFGVRFQPGSCILPEELSIRDLVNKDLEIDGNLFGDHMTEKLAGSKNISERVNVFTTEYAKLRGKELADGIQKLENYLRERIYDTDGCICIRQLAEETGYSECYIRRVFQQVHGISPKNFERFVRFQKLLHVINKMPERIRLDALAQQCGYYDEAHMIKDFKQYAGITPQGYERLITGTKISELERALYQGGKTMSLSRIEVITGMSKFSSLKAALSKAGVRGMTVMQVLGCGVEKGTREYEVDELEEMELLPKQQINIVVETERVNSIVEIIKEQLYTGHIGDGKIFIYKLDNVIRVRTGDEGEKAL